jgi:hypothetical protein
VRARFRSGIKDATVKDTKGRINRKRRPAVVVEREQQDVYIDIDALWVQLKDVPRMAAADIETVASGSGAPRLTRLLDFAVPGDGSDVGDDAPPPTNIRSSSEKPRHSRGINPAAMKARSSKRKRSDKIDSAEPNKQTNEQESQSRAKQPRRQRTESERLADDLVIVKHMGVYVNASECPPWLQQAMDTHGMQLRVRVIDFWFESASRRELVHYFRALGFDVSVDDTFEASGVKQVGLRCGHISGVGCARIMSDFEAGDGIDAASVTDLADAGWLVQNCQTAIPELRTSPAGSVVQLTASHIRELVAVSVASTDNARHGREEMGSGASAIPWLSVTGRDNFCVPFFRFLQTCVAKGASSTANCFVVNTDIMSESGYHWFTVACEWKKR